MILFIMEKTRCVTRIERRDMDSYCLFNCKLVRITVRKQMYRNIRLGFEGRQFFSSKQWWFYEVTKG
jgi:hypothetical protein